MYLTKKQIIRRYGPDTPVYYGIPGKESNRFLAKDLPEGVQVAEKDLRYDDETQSLNVAYYRVIRYDCQATATMTNKLYDSLSLYCLETGLSISKACRIAIMEKLQRDHKGQIPSAFVSVREALEHYDPWDVTIWNQDGEELTYFRYESNSHTEWDDYAPISAYFDPEDMSLQVYLDSPRKTCYDGAKDTPVRKET